MNLNNSTDNTKKASWLIIAAFMIVPLITSVVSTIHVVKFFELSNYYNLSITLAIAFELGALSSLAGLVTMDKISKSTVWIIFILLTVFQMMGNTYYSYDTTTIKMGYTPNLIKNFTELFGFDIYDESDVIFVKRIVAIISGAILPIISLCFLHLLMSYVIKSNTNIELTIPENIDSTEKNEESSESHKLDKENLENVESANLSEGKFSEHLKSKKEKLEKDRIAYTQLLHILYKNGTANEGEELPSYKDFVNLVDKEKFDDGVIKMFLTLCNYLSITKVSGEQKIALTSYEGAKKMLEGYLTLGNL